MGSIIFAVILMYIVVKILVGLFRAYETYREVTGTGLPAVVLTATAAVPTVAMRLSTTADDGIAARRLGIIKATALMSSREERLPPVAPPEEEPQQGTLFTEEENFEPEPDPAEVHNALLQMEVGDEVVEAQEGPEEDPVYAA